MLSVLIPYRPDGGHHDRNWAWTFRRWRALMPDLELVIQSDDGGSSPAEFNHPLALNRAAAQAGGDMLLVADIDIVPDPDWISKAVGMVAEGAPWVVAETYSKLDQLATEQVLSRDPAAPVPYGLTLEEPPVTSSCAPPVLISREGFEVSGGYDESVSWWGGDDAIFRICVDNFWGPMERCPGTALHLWHPAVEFHHPNQDVQQKLLFRYLEASGDRGAVEAVRYR